MNRGIFIRLVEAFGTMRYVAAITTVLLTLVYGVCNLIGWVPLYPQIATWLRLPNWGLLVVVHTVVWSIVAFLWYWSVLRQAAPVGTQLSLRRFFQQTDSTSLQILDLLLLGGFGAISYLLYQRFANPLVREITIYYTTVMLVPFVLNYLPFQVVPRYVVRTTDSGGVSTFRRIAELWQVDANEADITTSATLLREYNDPYISNTPDVDPLDDPLPQGFVVERPPRIQ